MNNYFQFTLTSDFFGDYSSPIDTIIVPSGNSKDPSDILKINVGSDVWSQTPTQVSFTNINLDIESLTSSDWSIEQKEEWLGSYLIHIGLDNKLTIDEFNEIMIYADSINIFEHISSPSIAYVNRNDGTNGYNDDGFITNEVFIGLNVYENNFVKEYADNLPVSALKDKIYGNIKSEPAFISNVCKVTYNGYSDIVWAFDKISFNNYNIDNIGEYSLVNGGGNDFAEVKLAGDKIQAHYKVRKNVNSNDPTIGYVSGQDKPFCMGDEIVIIDTSVFTENNSTSGWTWVGDFSVLNYTWHISDVSKPCEYYSNIPVFEILFPLRIINFCQYSDFG